MFSTENYSGFFFSGEWGNPPECRGPSMHSHNVTVTVVTVTVMTVTVVDSSVGKFAAQIRRESINQNNEKIGENLRLPGTTRSTSIVEVAFMYLL